MAKRTPKTEADDAAAATPGQAPKRSARSRASKAAPELDETQAARPTAADTHPPEDMLTADPRVTEANHFQYAGEPTEEDIRRRAYELYVQRGRQHGRHEDDWHRARRELIDTRKK